MKNGFKNIVFIFTMIIACMFSLSEKIYAKDFLIKVDSYLNGKVKIGEVNPIEVNVESLGKNIDGDLCLYVGDEKYEHPININGKNSKSYTFLVPINTAIKEVKVCIEENNKALGEKKFKVKAFDNKTLMVGLISDNKNNYNFLESLSLKPLEFKNVEIIDLKNKDLDFEYMKNVGIIVVDDFNSNSLTLEQQKNLDKWLNTGGIVFIGKNKYKDKNISGIFKNLNTKISIGEGMIIPVEFDVSDKKNILKLNTAIMKNINNSFLQKVTKNNNLKEEALKTKNLKSCANSILKINKNIIYVLISILVIYIIILFWCVITKRKKLYLWGGTILVISILVSIIYWFEGVGKEKITVAALNIYKGNRYTTNSLINVYPYKKDLNIKLNDSTFMYDKDSNNIVDPIEDKICVKPSFQTNYLCNMAIKSLKSENINSITLDKGYIKGEITNVFPYKLEECFLVAGDNVIEIGDLDGKETIELNYKVDHKLKDKGDYEYLNSMENCLKDKYNKRLLEYYFNENIDNKEYCKFIGFSRRKTVLNVNERNRKTNTVNMEVLKVNMNLNNIEKNKWVYGIVNPIVQREHFNDKDNVKEYTFKKDEDIKIYYPISKNVLVEKIKFSNTFKEGNFTLEIFDQKKNQWTKLDSLEFETNKYMKGINLIVLRVRGNGRFIIPSISFKGVIN